MQAPRLFISSSHSSQTGKYWDIPANGYILTRENKFKFNLQPQWNPIAKQALKIKWPICVYDLLYINVADQCFPTFLYLQFHCFLPWAAHFTWRCTT